jgi:hypothetical protein
VPREVYLLQQSGGVVRHQAGTNCCGCNCSSTFVDTVLFSNHLELGFPKFFSLRATLTPPLSPKGQYLKSSLLEFYKSLPLTQFDQLHKFARGFFSSFCTTYLCEKTFSKMKYTKNIYRSKLTDEHLKSLLIISTSKLDPQLQTIVSGKLQLHKSH